MLGLKSWYRCELLTCKCGAMCLWQFEQTFCRAVAAVLASLLSCRPTWSHCKTGSKYFSELYSSHSASSPMRRILVCRTAKWNVSGMPRTASTICGTHEFCSCSVGWRFRATEHMMKRAASIDSQEPVPEELLSPRSGH